LNIICFTSCEKSTPVGILSIADVCLNWRI
jgi:hypothetical protein